MCYPDYPEKFSFVFDIVPVSVNHYRLIKCINGKPVICRTRKANEMKEFIKWHTYLSLKKQGIKTDAHTLPLFKKPCKVSLSIVYMYNKKPKDIDNILKVLLDSLEGILFENDAQITELYIKKEKSKKNSISLEISLKDKKC